MPSSHLLASFIQEALGGQALLQLAVRPVTADDHLVKWAAMPRWSVPRHQGEHSVLSVPVSLPNGHNPLPTAPRLQPAVNRLGGHILQWSFSLECVQALAGTLQRQHYGCRRLRPKGDPQVQCSWVATSSRGRNHLLLSEVQGPGVELANLSEAARERSVRVIPFFLSPVLIFTM